MTRIVSVLTTPTEFSFVFAIVGFKYILKLLPVKHNSNSAGGLPIFSASELLKTLDTVERSP
jgi:hypothetical protein